MPQDAHKTSSAGRNTHPSHTRAPTTPRLTIQTENTTFITSTTQTHNILQNSKVKNPLFLTTAVIQQTSHRPLTVATTDIKTNMRHIHTSIVFRHLATRGNNKILRTPPPHIRSAEEIHPRLTRHNLAQLRTNQSPFLKSYYPNSTPNHIHEHYAPSATPTHMTRTISSTAPTYVPHCHPWFLLFSLVARDNIYIYIYMAQVCFYVCCSYCFLPCICLWQISQIQTCLCVVIGPGFVSTSPAFIRLAKNPVNRTPISGGRVFYTICTTVYNRRDSSTVCMLCCLEPDSSSITSSTTDSDGIIDILVESECN